MFYSLIRIFASGMENKPRATSYKRRMNGWDYTQPRIYMLTLATEGRQPLFGTLTGDPTLPAAAPEGPHLQPTELGAAVLQEVDGIPRFYPQITIIARQLMPDHLHILLYVRQALPVHIGQVVAGFKAGCNRRWRELGCPQMPQHPQQPQQPQRQNRWAPNNAAPGSAAAAVPGSAAAHSAPASTAATGSVASSHGAVSGSVAGGSAARKNSGLLWEQGYHDRVLSNQGQLQRLVDYILDNPRRSLIKRNHPDWFRPRQITAAGTTLHALGNLQLLQAASRRAVRVSNHITDEQRISQQQDLLTAARQGTVLISPFISAGERQVEEAAMQERLPLVKLLDNGFAPYYKPQGQDFDTCAEGRLLLLTPYDYTTQKVILTRSMCNNLNVLAARLCE